MACHDVAVYMTVVCGAACALFGIAAGKESRPSVWNGLGFLVSGILHLVFMTASCWLNYIGR